ncbi:MAG: hypothetical protein B0D82_00735 [Candidatus Sedimenticola endophacoides]|nr:MAG: hypothetical protein B0D82_00735 [Candidatus Sedimenticola endophacoides]
MNEKIIHREAHWILQWVDVHVFFARRTLSEPPRRTPRLYLDLMAGGGLLRCEFMQFCSRGRQEFVAQG